MVAKTETFGGGLDDLRAFCAVVDLGTVTAAAASRGETKGSLSRRISRLEAALGAILMARHPRAVSPTAEGLAFYAKVQESLALLDEAAETARDAPHRSCGPPSRDDLGRLRHRADAGDRRELPPGLPADHVDMINTDARLDLAANRSISPCAWAMWRRPLQGRADPASLGRALRGAGLPRAASSADELAALAEHDLILSRERPGALGIMLSDGQGRTEQVALSPAVRASDFAAVLRLTLAGTGIGHLPSAVAAGSVANGALVRVLAPWATAGGALRAVSLAGRELPARVRVFREHVRSEMMKRFAVEPDQAEGT